MKKVFVLIMSVLIFLVLLVFALNNLEPVTLKFVGDIQWNMRMIILIISVFAVGCFTGMFAMLPFAYKRRCKKNKVSGTEVIPVN